MSYTSYKLYQKYLQYGSDAPVPAYPMEYSYNADGTMPAVVRMANDPACGEPQPLPPIIDDYSTQYLTIESLEDNNVIGWMAGAIAGGGITAKTISASTDNGVTWTAYTSTSGGSGTTIATLNAGDKLIIKGENTAYGHNSINRFISTGQFNVYGNIMSMISGDSFDGATTLTEEMTFQGLFEVCTGLTSAEHLILPATTLTRTCYVSMFNGCTSLTKAPELPATTLKSNCYRWMFYNCSSLNYIKCLATDISPNSDTYNWVSGVASTGTFVKNSAATWTTGVNGIPDGWTVQNA